MKNKISILTTMDSPEKKMQLSENKHDIRFAVTTGKALPADVSGRHNLHDALRCAADKGKRIHFIDEEGNKQSLTYQQLLNEAQNVAKALFAQIEHAPAALILQTRHLKDTIITAWAGWLAGIPVVPLAVASSDSTDDVKNQKLSAVLNTLNSAVIICDENGQDRLLQLTERDAKVPVSVISLTSLSEIVSEGILPDVRSEQPALYLLTSGSTSAPKLVVQSHGNILNRSRASQMVNRFTTEDVSLNWLPLDHVGGIVMFHLQDVITGCEQFQVATDYVLQDPLRWLDLCSEHEVTLTWAPNFAFELINSKSKHIIARNLKLNKLRFILNGGESIVARQAHQFIRNLASSGLPSSAMTPSWGMSETCSGVTFSHSFLSCHEDAPFVPVGEPVPGISLRIVDDKGTIKLWGQEGHLQISGCSVFSGYLGADSQNSSFSADGWFNTGDLASITEQGVSIVGRDKDVIIINGRNIAFHEIEACINVVEGVDPTNSCVFTQRNTHDLLCVAFTTSFEEDELEKLITRIRTRIREAFSISPDLIWRLSPGQISKTSIGKIQRKKVQQTIADARIAPLWSYGPVAENRLAHHTFRRLWQPQALSEPTMTIRRIVLVCSSSHALSEMQRVFVDTNVSVYPVYVDKNTEDASLKDALQVQLSTAGSADHLIFLADSNRELLIKEQAISLLTPLVALLQVWAASNCALPVMVMTLNGQRVLKEDRPVNPVSSLVTSLMRSARAELPGFRGRVVDITEVSPDVISEVLTEISTPAEDTEIAWRNGTRYVSRLAKLPVAEKVSSVCHDSKYVLIGGLGGVGSVLAEQLAKNANAHIWLIGRTPVEEMNADRLMRLAQLKKISPHIHYLAADVTDYPKLADAISRIQSSEGGTIGRIYQLAGNFSLQKLTEIAPERDFVQLDSKVQGSSNLYSLAKEFAVPSLVMCSSANGYLAGAGVALYAAANRYQEALAELAIQEDRLQVTSVGWSMLKDTGLSKGFAHQALTEAKGYLVADAKQAIALLEPLIATGEHACIVGLDPAAPALVNEFCYIPSVQTAENTELNDPASHTEITSASNSVHAVAETIATIWKSLLELDELEWDENLFDLGANSLLLPQVILWLERELGFRPSLVDLFQYPDVASLAEFVSRNLAQKSAEASVQNIKEKISIFWREHLEMEDFSDDENIFDLGATSLHLPQLQYFIEKDLHRKASLVNLFQYPSVSTLAGFLNEQQPS